MKTADIHEIPNITSNNHSSPSRIALKHWVSLNRIGADGVTMIEEQWRQRKRTELLFKFDPRSKYK